MTIQNEILCKCLGFSVFNVGLEFLPPDFDFGKSIIILNGVYQYDQPSCQEVQCNDCVFALDVNISCASDKDQYFNWGYSWNMTFSDSII